MHALIFQENGFVPRIIEKMEIDFSRMKQLLDRDLKSLPTYSSSSNGRLISSSNVNQILIYAEEEANKLNDEYISVEHILIALTREGLEGAVGKIFAEIGLNKKNIIVSKKNP